MFASYRADDLHRRHPLRPLLAELIRLPAVERLELRPMADPEWPGWCARCAAVRCRTPRSGGSSSAPRATPSTRRSCSRRARHGPGGVPSGLADVLLIRFEQLSDTAQQVLRTAAVAGRRVEHDLLRDAVGLPEDELESALREAVGRQLLVSGDSDTYAFRHALAREAVYADLLPGERARLHGAFARLLAGGGRRRERGGAGPPLPGEPRPGRGADRVAGGGRPRRGARRARRGTAASGSGPGPVVGGGAVRATPVRASTG